VEIVADGQDELGIADPQHAKVPRMDVPQPVQPDHATRDAIGCGAGEQPFQHFARSGQVMHFPH
jgi:hypothetical protein